MSELRQRAFDVVRELRARLDRAHAAGQVELHVDLMEMELALSLAEALVNAFEADRA